MRVLLRADAARSQGTGHVMRCLTLAEELRSRGHIVQLLSGPLEADWLEAAVRESGVQLRRCLPNAMPTESILEFEPDWVVVDSYLIPSAAVSRLNRTVAVLAIIDGDDRGIDAALYLDQNLGAESLARPALRGRLLAGSDFSLVRRAVLEARRPDPWRWEGGSPGVLSFMGGTDPTRASVSVAEALAEIDDDFTLSIVAPQQQHSAVLRGLMGRPNTRVLAPTRQLPALIGRADIVISASGTSAWDICTLGIPAVLVAVVDNQRASLREAVSRGLTLGFDATAGTPSLREGIRPLATRLLREEPLRRRLSERCSSTFDGGGTTRVVDEMEREATGESRDRTGPL